jgi:hypothetical protein
LTVNGRSLEELGHLLHALCLWVAFPLFPTAKSAGINPELSRKNVLSYAEGTSK